MTHEEIVSAVREVIGLPTGDLVTAIAGKSTAQGGLIRQGLEDKVKDALAELFNDPAQTPTERTFQDKYFPYVKNAAANPLANVLGGQDAWGRARKEELKGIIREVVNEA